MDDLGLIMCEMEPSLTRDGWRWRRRNPTPGEEGLIYGDAVPPHVYRRLEGGRSSPTALCSAANHWEEGRTYPTRQEALEALRAALAEAIGLTRAPR